jgi:hypothetical protein
MKRLLELLDIKIVFGALLGFLLLIGGSALIAFLLPYPWNLPAVLAFVLLIGWLDVRKLIRTGIYNTFLFPNSYHVMRSPVVFTPAYVFIAWLFWNAVAPWTLIPITAIAIFYVWWEHLRPGS